MRSAHDRTANEEVDLHAHPPSLDSFIAYLTEIAESDHPITPQSHLIDDLDLDAVALSCLDLLMCERYGIGGLSIASLDSENLTVGGFFQHCILDVLGCDANQIDTRASND